MLPASCSPFTVTVPGFPVQIVILAVGKLRPALRDLCNDYHRRLAPYARVDEREVREASRAPSLAAQQAEEAERLLAKAPANATAVALARGGTLWTSVDLAKQLERWMLGARPLALLIGGSTGLSMDLVQRAAFRWSLGPLTLPHELVRVVVYEQLYRGFTILRGEPYHKGGET